MEVPPKEVQENLYPGENILFCIKKKMSLEAKPKYITITNRRVLYLDQKILGRYDLIDLPYEKLETVYFKQGAIGSEFKLKNEDGSVIALNWLDKTNCKDAICSIRDAINQIAIEPVGIQKKKGLMGREEWKLSKPKEVVFRGVSQTPSAATSPVQNVQQDGPAEKLKKLKELHEMGVISDEEYKEKRDSLVKIL